MCVHKSKCPSQLGRFFSPKPLIAQLRFSLCKVTTRTLSSPSWKVVGFPRRKKMKKEERKLGEVGNGWC